jgi:hypothetical protein
MRIIYEHKEPSFGITADDLQWVLLTNKQSNGRWLNREYFSNITMLLETLAEQQFRSQAPMVREIKELDATVSQVYQLIEEVTGEWCFRGKSEAAIDRWRAENIEKDE